MELLVGRGLAFLTLRGGLLVVGFVVATGVPIKDLELPVGAGAGHADRGRRVVVPLIAAPNRAGGPPQRVLAGQFLPATQARRLGPCIGVKHGFNLLLPAVEVFAQAVVKVAGVWRLGAVFDLVGRGWLGDRFWLGGDSR